ncbi:hypothetical protein ACFXG4_22160 [Nocardia sp. NPDC059246]|uniref:hypothetical protein n=1 Tax=unclassified Nocardia TaxID=2637762 RepID=UPI0036C22F50
MIAFTLPEIRRLLIAFVLTRFHPADHIWAWSRWRAASRLGLRPFRTLPQPGSTAPGRGRAR